MDRERQRIVHKRRLENLIEQYKKNISVIDGIDKKFSECITNTNMKYEKKQIIVYKMWEYEQNKMQLALENVIDDIESLKNININSKQTIYMRSLTIESKLLTIMAKYDTEIGSRCKILEELSQIYKYNILKKHELEEEMKQQEEVYFLFVKQKDLLKENNIAL